MHLCPECRSLFTNIPETNKNHKIVWSYLKCKIILFWNILHNYNIVILSDEVIVIYSWKLIYIYP